MQISTLRHRFRQRSSNFGPALLALCVLGALGACESETSTTSAAPEAATSNAATASTSLSAPEPATLILTGGKIVTVDPELGNHAAIALRGTTIAAVGSTEEMQAYVGEATETIDLKGRMVMPGFIEGHGHYLSLGRARQILDLADAKTWNDIVGKVAVAVDKAEPGEWIFGRGWHQDKWDGEFDDTDEVVDGVPANKSISAISRNNPVYLGHASGHAAYANEAALAAAGIGRDTEDPAGGTIVRTADGEASGLLRENAQDAVERAVAIYDQRLSPEEVEATLTEQSNLAAQEALRHGVTSFHDAGASFEVIDFFKRLEEKGELPVRLYVMVRGESNETMEERLSDYYMPAVGNDFLTVRSIKRQIDGALGAHGAWLLEPYNDLPNTPGLVLEPVEEIERTAELAIANGYQLNTHAIGTRANRETLDVYERTWQQESTDGTNLRWRIEHAQHIHPADVPRFGKLGVIAAMQGIHCVSDGPWIASRLGVERTKYTSYLWRQLLETGAVIGNGTDVPVEPIDPIASFTASVTRITNTGEPFYPEHIMTREEALQSYTINNAYAAFEEDIKGSLTPGKLADLVVLSQDILTVADAELPQTKIDYTLVGGEIKYARADAI